MMVRQLRRAGVSVRAFLEDYSTSSFELIPVDTIRNVANIFVDPDTGGLLHTIAMPGEQG